MKRMLIIACMLLAGFFMAGCEEEEHEHHHYGYGGYRSRRVSTSWISLHERKLQNDGVSQVDVAVEP